MTNILKHNHCSFITNDFNKSLWSYYTHKHAMQHSILNTLMWGTVLHELKPFQRSNPSYRPKHLHDNIFGTFNTKALQYFAMASAKGRKRGHAYDSSGKHAHNNGDLGLALVENMDIAVSL